MLDVRDYELGIERVGGEKALPGRLFGENHANAAAIGSSLASRRVVQLKTKSEPLLRVGLTRLQSHGHQTRRESNKKFG
jgi:hypothetical protein